MSVARMVSFGNPPRRIETGEAASGRHPDKVADQISDAVLDAVLAEDPAARVVCEVLVSPRHATLAGEYGLSAEAQDRMAAEFRAAQQAYAQTLNEHHLFPGDIWGVSQAIQGAPLVGLGLTTKEVLAHRAGALDTQSEVLWDLVQAYWASPEVRLDAAETTPVEAFLYALNKVARDCLRKIGCHHERFNWRALEIDNRMQGVGVTNEEEESWDHGVVFGYATQETPNLMPAAQSYANRILQSLDATRRAGELPGILPNSQIQVSLGYYLDTGECSGVQRLTASVQNQGLNPLDVRKAVASHVRQVIPEGRLPRGWENDLDFLRVNPYGSEMSGPERTAGLTGRKIMADTYGSTVPHGGGSFSGKDPSKMERSAAYAARYLAKNVVAAGLADRCTIQLSYAGGVAEPLFVAVDTHATGRVDEALLAQFLPQVMDLRPAGIVRHLGLHKPIYARTAAGGHFGREPEADGGFSWERTDLVDALRANFAKTAPEACT